MSSRNALLSPDEKTRALSIHQSLKKAEECIRAGETDSAVIEGKVRSVIEKNGSPERIDYITIVDYETLVPVSAISRTSVLAVAAYFGNTRLIDNMIITPGDNTPCAY
jgi:pantoate--beta-alanine ligase